MNPESPAGDAQPKPPPARRRRGCLWGLPRFAWLLFGITLLLLGVVELILRAGFAAKEAWWPLPTVDSRLVSDGYAGETWVPRHFEEYRALVADWHPYVNIRVRPFRGETITVLPGGVRKTWNPPLPADGKALRVWLFGGSAAWGVGARDDFTIASLLAKELHERGIAAQVTNFAEIGYVSTQEYLWLALQLRSGARPDVVIFYDGVNDMLSALQNGEAGWPENETNRRRAFEAERSPATQIVEGMRGLVRDSALNRFARAVGARLQGRSSERPNWAAPRLETGALAASVLDTYKANTKLVTALARAYGFEAVYCWQPDLFTKPRPSPFERDELAKYAALSALFNATHQQLRDRTRPGMDLAFVHNLSDIFGERARTFYADFCHTTEAANALIAARLASHVQRALEH